MSIELQPLDPTKYGLALHTTTPELGLAISNFAADTRYGVWNLERELSSLLHQYLIEFIQPQTWADLAFIAVAKGPGGFTGTRIGVVAARTLGQQLDIPVFAISTLAALAWSEYISQILVNREGEMGISSDRPYKQENTTASLGKEGWGEQTIAVQMPAQRGQIFAAIYQLAPDTCGLKVLLPDTVLTPVAWQEKLASWHNSYRLIEAKSGLAATVTSILQLAYLEWQQGKRPHWSEALPFYGQHPVEL
ncbi:MAG: tRNA (adenosine(37)-N6)-threonylcarbamoyltransferase complex dimerization subunit type 1 TsaB [Fischerella sp.]|nr:tRNA (adenosine(37)-N6)-threonylcarbamoyltransferase complex dimerization subunit type 1 TsaB [Fischerella sp.]